ncbi:MAG: OmpA family protein [Paracoccaceae bacterium]
MRRNLSKTTALIASLSLAIPAPIFAQEAPPACSDGSDAPCMPGMEPLGDDGLPVPGTTMSEDEIAARKAAEEAAAGGEAAPEEPAPAEEMAPAAEEPAPAQVEEPAPAAEETAPTAEEPAPAAEVAAPAEEPAPATGEAAPAAEEAAPAEETAPATTEEPAPAEETAPAMTEELAPATTLEPAPATEETAPAATEEPAPATGEAEPPATEEAAPAGEETAPAATDDAATGEAAPATEETAPVSIGNDITEVPAEIQATAPELPAQPDAATGEAPVAAAAEAPTDPEAEVEGATVVEETVTEDSVRSSSEDFATKVNQALTPEQAAAAAADTAAVAETAATAGTAAAPAVKKKRLTDFEKALLIGLGAVAVGAILSNNRRVAANSGDRIVVQRDDGSYGIIKDDDTLLRQPGDTVRTERFRDGSTRTTVTRPDGSRIVTIRDAEYRVLRRVHIARDGRQTLLIDDTAAYEPVVVTTLPKPRKVRDVDLDDEMALRLALADQARTDRSFSLAQIRDIARVRQLAPAIDLQGITFDSGSAAISPDQARTLAKLGGVIEEFIADNPGEVFLVEGHTDAVGGAAYNLALSDRRAETVALALTEYFDIPPENLVTQGYGEAYLKIDTQGDERANRRATVRRITDLLRQAAAN